MPLGNFEGWYFSEELKFAYEHGYTIEIIKGYKFNKSENVFKKYVEEIYEKKSSTKDDVIRSISKSLLNNLLGRFGLRLDRSDTKLVSEEEYLELLQYKAVRPIWFIGDKVFISYDKDVSPSICESHDVDYRKTLYNDIKVKNLRNKESNFHDVSIAIASAVTSYSRIYMNKIKMSILNNGGSIFYTDTDSVVTDVELNNNLVGDGIGMFKLEHKLKEAFFIGAKTYALKKFDSSRLEINKTLIKAKGVNSNKLIYEQFLMLYLGLDVKTSRLETKKKYASGSVQINIEQPITLSANMYKKRNKIYKNKIWVDTKPMYHNMDNVE